MPHLAASTFCYLAHVKRRQEQVFLMRLETKQTLNNMPDHVNPEFVGTISECWELSSRLLVLWLAHRRGAQSSSATLSVWCTSDQWQIRVLSRVDVGSIHHGRRWNCTLPLEFSTCILSRNMCTNARRATNWWFHIHSAALYMWDHCLLVVEVVSLLVFSCQLFNKSGHAFFGFQYSY